MPAYNASAISVDKPVLTESRPITLWDAETPLGVSPPVSVSRQFCLHRYSNLPNCLSVEIEFDGDPGNFQIDLETADTDENKYYVTRVTVTQAGLNDSNVARIEVVDLVAKFGRLSMVSCGNADVEVTARVS